MPTFVGAARRKFLPCLFVFAMVIVAIKLKRIKLIKKICDDNIGWRTNVCFGIFYCSSSSIATSAKKAETSPPGANAVQGKDVEIAVEDVGTIGSNDINCESSKSESDVGQADTSIISCWSQKQYDHFRETYPWMIVTMDKNGEGRLGCSVCSQCSSLGCEQQKQIHLSTEWRDCTVSVSSGSTKSKQQTSARKKLYLHHKSDAHNAASGIVEAKKSKTMEAQIIKMREFEYEKTMNCMRTAYYVAHQARPFTDHDDLIQLQQANGAEMGSILHSPSCCTEMVKIIAGDMRDNLYKIIREKDAKIALIIDESTTLSQKSTLIVYLRFSLQNEICNVFIDLIELSAQDSSTIVQELLLLLTSRCNFTEDFLRRNLVGFCSDGASVMLGKNSGVGTVLKQKYPQLVLWHCLAHRLELAVSDAMDDVSNTYQFKSFIDKLHSVYSKSPKLLRQLEDIAKSLGDVILSMGRMLTTRWVASSYRVVKSVLHNYSPLYEHFSTASADRQLQSHTRNELSAMGKVIASKSFVENLLLLNDVLAELSMLSKVLQGQSITIGQAQRQIQWAIEGLQRRKEKAYELYTLNEATFKSVPLTDRKSHKSIPKAQFLQAIIDRLQQRLMSTEENKALSEQFEVLHRNKWPTDVSPPWADGERLVTELSNRFSVDAANAVVQFREYMHSSTSAPEPETTELASLMIIEQTVPISSAEAERGFSQMNLIVTDSRSRLLVTNVSDILFIRLNGPASNLWDPASATKSWLLKGHRQANDTRSKVIKKAEQSSQVAKLFSYK